MSTPADPLSLERALGGNYRVLRLLGRGGMGAVYLARDETLDRLVAIKVISPQAPDHAAGRERFRREARTAPRLSHPVMTRRLRTLLAVVTAIGIAEVLLVFALLGVAGQPASERVHVLCRELARDAGSERERRSADLEETTTRDGGGVG